MIGTRFWLLNELLKLCTRAAVAYRVAIATLSGVVTLFAAQDMRESVVGSIGGYQFRIAKSVPCSFQNFLRGFASIGVRRFPYNAAIFTRPA